mgnify:CR=1 FL=1
MIVLDLLLVIHVQEEVFLLLEFVLNNVETE